MTNSTSTTFPRLASLSRQVGQPTCSPDASDAEFAAMVSPTPWCHACDRPADLVTRCECRPTAVRVRPVRPSRTPEQIELDRITDAFLHPTGKCRCFGEGRCEWCRETVMLEAEFGDGDERGES